MESQNSELSAVLEALEEIRGAMARLESRVESLESRRMGPAMSGARRMPGGEKVDEETVRAIAAAVAAYLGKSAPIRSIQLMGASRAWAQEGRVTIQARYSVSPPHPTR